MGDVDVNGGNAEVAHSALDLVDVEEVSSKSGEVEVEEDAEHEIEIEDQEFNGDNKTMMGKKIITPIGKRKLRKSKANSTSAIEDDQESNANKGRKRKLSEVDGVNTDDSMDFSGFDKAAVEISPPGLEILQKIIANEEGSQPGKRIKRSKGPRRNIEFKTVDDHSGLLDANEMKSRIDDVADPLESDDDSDDLSKSQDSKAPSPSNSNLSTMVNKRGVNNTRIKAVIEPDNSVYHEPFKFGWKREVIYKNESENAQKKFEIYYYTPKGKRVRNLREVSEFLNPKELAMENFTFVKESVGINDPELEIIRDDASDMNSSNAASLLAKKNTTVNKRGGPTRRSTVKTASPPPPPSKNSAKSSITAKTSNPGSFKVKVTAKKGLQKKEAASPRQDVEVNSPTWNSTPTMTKRNQAEKTSSSYKTKRLLKKKPAAVVETVDQRQYLMATVSAGYNALSRVFQYLKVQELLRAARVCKMWRDLAAHPALWKTVRMKNSQVTDWDGMVATLQRHGTQHLDLRKMLITGESESVWKKFVAVIPKVHSLVKLELCRCPVMVVQDVIKACPQLEVLSAMAIKCDWLNLDSIGNLSKCQELRLKSQTGMLLHGDLTPLEQLTQLTHLSLTSVKELGKKKMDVLSSLVNLECLELGECSDFPPLFGTQVLSKLTKLERLRLEKGQGTCCTFDILAGICNLEKLQQLELVNFDVKSGFDKCLAECRNIKRLLIIPTYISQSATSNNMVLGGVTELSNNLTHFVWGVTLELLRVTELFVDQCNQMNKQVSGDSIPVLKPVPCLKLIENTDDENNPLKADEKQPNLSNPQVDILPLPQLQKLLLTALPKTRVKILKIPFHATWRQNISDTSQ